jgi:hypothetical protein
MDGQGHSDRYRLPVGSRVWSSVSEGRELTVRIQSILGAASPYSQGGSLRITLPKQIARVYGLQRSSAQELEKKVFVFIETDYGIFLMPLEKALQNPDLQYRITE